jgi:xanthine dehydrogenase iron-sulfur cluster and FAD-binding subunit A
MNDVTLTINGKPVSGVTEPRVTLLDFLRDVAGLKGTHAGCEHGVCGACTVLIDGTAVRSCLMLAVQAEGEDIITIEGIGGSGARAGELGVIQDAFCETHGPAMRLLHPGHDLGCRSVIIGSIQTQPNMKSAKPFQAIFAVAPAMFRLSTLSCWRPNVLASAMMPCRPMRLWLRGLIHD